MSERVPPLWAVVGGEDDGRGRDDAEAGEGAQGGEAVAGGGLLRLTNSEFQL